MIDKQYPLTISVGVESLYGESQKDLVQYDDWGDPIYEYPVIMVGDSVIYRGKEMPYPKHGEKHALEQWAGEVLGVLLEDIVLVN